MNKKFEEKTISTEPIYNGRIIKELSQEEADQEKIMYYALGGEDGE